MLPLAFDGVGDLSCADGWAVNLFLKMLVRAEVPVSTLVSAGLGVLLFELIPADERLTEGLRAGALPCCRVETCDDLARSSSLFKRSVLTDRVEPLAELPGPRLGSAGLTGVSERLDLVPASGRGPDTPDCEETVRLVVAPPLDERRGSRGRLDLDLGWPAARDEFVAEDLRRESFL